MVKVKVEFNKRINDRKRDDGELHFSAFALSSRWSELSSDDIKYMFNKPKVTSNGYLMQVGVRPVTTVPKVSPLANYTFSDRNYEYLDKIKDLCNKRV